MNRPLAVNISFGNTYGSHDGTSLLETFINDMSGIGRNVIVAGTGNEEPGPDTGQGAWSWGRRKMRSCPLHLMRQGWEYSCGSPYVDQFSIRLVTPSGEIIGPIDSRLGPQELRYGERRS